MSHENFNTITLLKDARAKFAELERIHWTCGTCGEYKSHDDAKHEERYRELDGDIERAIAVEDAESQEDADEIFYLSDEEWATIERENIENLHIQPLGELLAEVVDSVAEGATLYYERRKVYVEGRKRRKSIVMVCCSTCAGEQQLDRELDEPDYDNFPHKFYCVVIQARILRERITQK